MTQFTRLDIFLLVQLGAIALTVLALLGVAIHWLLTTGVVV